VPTIRVPAPLRAHTDGRAVVEVEGGTVCAALEALAAAHPAAGTRVLDDAGRLHRFVNVFVGDDDVRDLRGLDTTVGPDDVLAIVPAVAGG
jgi:molybdopterin synthase sulfur carrier subunit